MTQTPSLANPPLLTTPPGNRFTAPLHGILSRHGPYLHLRLRLCLQYRHICHYHNIYEHTVALRACPLLRQISDSSAIIYIISYALTLVSDMIRLTVYGFIWLTLSDFIQIFIYNLTWLMFFTWFDSLFFNWFDSVFLQFDLVHL